MQKSERCAKCGAEPEKRKVCPRCGETVWVLEHGAHYMDGAREVIDCSCPSFHSVLGRRREAIGERRAKRIEAGKRADWNRPVTTPAMAKKAAENLARGMKPYRALKDAGFPESSCKKSSKGVNRMVRAELKTMTRKYIQMARDLTPEDQELIVRGKLIENILTNSDKAVMSAKQLGADKRVAMWRADSQVGVVVLTAPPIPKIDHEVPLIESRFKDEEEVEDDSADLRLSSRRQPPTSSRQGRMGVHLQSAPITLKPA